MIRTQPRSKTWATLTAMRANITHPGRNLGKTNPLNDDDLAEFIKLQKKLAASDKSWTVDAKEIDSTTFDLSVKNPNGGEEVVHRSPQDIMKEIATLEMQRAPKC